MTPGATALLRAQSLLGVGPLGLYLIYHLYDHWPAVHGREQWVERAIRHPTPSWLIVLLGAMLVAHAALGALRLLWQRGEGSALPGRYMQAATGLGIAAFIVYHVAQVWAPGAGPHTSVRDVYDALWRMSGQPLHLTCYLLGITAAWFHFAHGLSRAASTFGLVSTARGILFARMLAGGIGFVLWLMMLQLLAHFALGAPLLSL